MNKPLPCIVCGKNLENAIPDNLVSDLENQPHAGTVFYSHGQYGSTVFDEMNNSFLEINVCDDCLVGAARSGKVIFRVPLLPKTEYESKFWNPEEET